MNFQPLVSVCLMSYNQSEFLLNAIKSLQQQSYKNLQIIITDNGSNDGSKEIIKSVQDNRIVFLDYPTNEPVTKRFNQAVSHALGDFISFLYSDDYYLPNKIERQIKIFEELDDSWGVVHTPGITEDIISGVRDIAPSTKAHGSCFVQLLDNFSDGFINPISPLTRTKLFKEYPSYENLFMEGESLFYRFAMKYKFFYLDEPLVVMRYHESNTGKAIKRNTLSNDYVLESLPKFKEFPKKYLPNLIKHSSYFKRSVGWHAIRSNYDVKWGRSMLYWSIKLDSLSIVNKRTLMGLALSVLPAFIRRKANQLLNRFATKKPFDILENYEKQ